MHNRIKELRKILNLTQREFAQKLGLSASTITMIEKDARPLQPFHVRAICLIWNINEEWLVNGTGEIFIKERLLIDIQQQYSLSDTELQLMKNYLSMDTVSRKYLINSLEFLSKTNVNKENNINNIEDMPKKESS